MVMPIPEEIFKMSASSQLIHNIPYQPSADISIDRYK